MADLETTDRTTERRLREALTQPTTPLVKRKTDGALFVLQTALCDRDTVILLTQEGMYLCVPTERFWTAFEVTR